MLIKSWDTVLTEEDTHETIKKLVEWHLSKVESKVLSNRLTSLFDGNGINIAGLSFDIDYSALGLNDSYHCRQILAFFQKRKDLEFGIDKEAVALEKFRESELKCSETNRIFKHWASGGFNFPPDVDAVLHGAARKIALVLGDVPTLESLNLGFGPGATTQIKRKISSPRSKLGQKFCCSEDLIPLLPELLGEMPAWLPRKSDDEIWDELMPSGIEELLTTNAVDDDELRRIGEEFLNKLQEYRSAEEPQVNVDVEIHPCLLSFVPKNARTARGICTEPSLNVMLQKGIGQYMTHRLKRFGVDLLDQSVNKKLAQEGSLTGALATLDLSSASDLIATELVYHLLPIDWFIFLSRARSGLVMFEGVESRLHKFSSMGNGFTFPLESLIFWAIAKACCLEEETVSVYGDDIIIPTARKELVVKALVAAGFLINIEKSFFEGPFRESCGGDYFLGTDIRPFYLKDRLSGESAFSMHNYYVRRGLFEPATILLAVIQDPVKIWGPDGYGDGHLVGDYVHVPHNRGIPHEYANIPQCYKAPFNNGVTKWYNYPDIRGTGWDGHTFNTYTHLSIKSYQAWRGDNVLPCYSIYADCPVNDLRKHRYLDPWGDRPDTFTSFRAVTAFYRKGVLGNVVPGHEGYKMISIYVLGR